MGILHTGTKQQLFTSEWRTGDSQLRPACTGLVGPMQTESLTLFAACWNYSESSPYTRATHRAMNFGTTLSGANNTIEAVVNDRIIEAFQTPSKQNYEVILRIIKTIYAQSAIRNAYLLDQDLTSDVKRFTDDHRGEGQALYRIIAPFVKEKDKTCHQFMDEMYILPSVIIPYCPGLCRFVTAH